MLDTGRCEDVTGPDGAARVIRPPETTLFHQVPAYLRARPDPATRPSGSAAGREGVAAAAVVLRWGSYLAVLLDRDKPLWPAVRSKGTSHISDAEMARINIEASAALAEWDRPLPCRPQGPALLAARGPSRELPADAAEDLDARQLYDCRAPCLYPD